MVIFEQEVFDFISETKGDILDVGYGWGISSELFL